MALAALVGRRVMRAVILFDIDATLVLSGGAGLRGLNRAFEEELQIQGACTGVALPGRTDRAILAEVLARVGIPHDDELEARLRDRYCECLLEDIRRPNPTKGVLPGVTALLDTLAEREDVSVGLLTGNFFEAARIKLEYFALWHHFPFGAFGGDALDRRDLFHVALRRVTAVCSRSFIASQVIVVGDTPLDIECARAAGATSVAVATGTFDEESLRAAGADVALRDLTDAAAVLRVIDRVSASRPT